MALPLAMLVASAAILPVTADDTRNGWLSVSIEPAISAPISVDGVVRNTGAISRLELPPGDYWVDFGQVESFVPPATQRVQVAGNETTELRVQYQPAGVLDVTVTPDGIDPLVSVDGVPRDMMGTTIAIASGDSIVCGEPVAGYLTPGCQTVDVTTGVTTRVALAYEVPPLEDEAVGGPRVSEGLVALYDFGDGSGGMITDSAGVVEGMDLTIANPSATTWGQGALTFDEPTIATTGGAPTGLYERVQTTGEFTVEAWIEPDNLTQNGPARIVSLGKDTSNANVVVGQGSYQGAADLIEARHQRVGDYQLPTDEGSLTAGLTHVVTTRAADGTVTVYIDGQVQASRVMDGDPADWDTSYRLALGAELDKTRHWLGTYHLVVLYNTALTPDQVATNHNAGPNADTPQPDPEPTVSASDEPMNEAPEEWREVYDSGDMKTVRAWYAANTGHEANGYEISDLEPVGHLVTEYDGQIIEGVHATSIRIAHDDVTIRNSRITGDWRYGLRYLDTWGQKVGGTLIEYVTFDGWKSSSVGNSNHAAYLAASTDGATVRRVRISGYSSGVSMRSNISFEESWVHNLYRDEAGTHGTSSTIRGENNASVRNLLEGPGGSSAVSLYADTGGPLDNALVEHNILADSRPNYQINMPNREHSAESRNVRVRHNRYGPETKEGIAGAGNFSHPSNDIRDNVAF